MGLAHPPRRRTMSRQARAQAMVLRSLLKGEVLPGSGGAILFPDLGLFPDAGRVVFVDDRVRDSLELGAGVLVARPGEPPPPSAADEATLIFEFLPPEPVPGRVSVRLRVSVARGDGGPTPLGEVIAVFQDRDPLAVVDPPSVLSF